MKVALLSGVVIVIASAFSVGAEDAPAELGGSDNGARISFDSSLEVTTRKSASATGSLTVSPYGTLDANAVLFRVEGTIGRYRYANGDPPPLFVNGRSIDASALLGLQAAHENVTAAVFLGWNSQSNNISINDRENPTSGAKTGLKGLVELGFNPSDRILVQGSLSLSRANRAYRVELKSGYQFLPNLYAGPQVVFQGDDYFRQWKFGAYASGLKVGSVELGLAAGLLHDAKQGNGAYFQISSGLRF